MKYILISLIIVCFDFVGVLNMPKNALLGILQPVQLGISSIAISIKDSVNFYTNLKSIRDENILLLQKVSSLESVILDLKSFSEENKVLYDQLGITNEKSIKKYVVARVLGNPDDITGSSIFLDKGELQGILVGNNVILGNHLIGIVSKVTPNRSVIDLISSPKLSISVYDIDSKNKTQGVAVGQHGSALSMEKILQSEVINIGDSIVTSGKDGLFFPGLYVGQVTSVENTPSQPLKKALLQPVVDLSKLERVFVVLN